MLRRFLLVVAALAVVIGAHAQGSGEQPSDSTAAAAPANPSPAETVQEVTVTAQRATLTKRVTAFINKITGTQFERGLTLWRSPVCPLVSGVPRADGEFILDRISEVARADGIPVAGENC